MRTYDEIAETARAGRAFSNSTSFEIWSANHGCWTCRNDDDATEKYCPILSVALASGKTPAEWVEMSDRVQDYTCTEYDRRPDDDDGDDPEPEPDPGPPPVIEGQVDMFEVFAEQIAETATAEQVSA